MSSQRRAVQRKLIKISKTLRESSGFEEIRSALDAIHSKKNLDFLEDEEEIATYEDDFHRFKTDVENAFAMYVKKKSRTDGLLTCELTFQDIMRMHFPGEFPDLEQEEAEAETKSQPRNPKLQINKDRSGIAKFKMSSRMRQFLAKGNHPITSLPKAVINQILSTISKQPFSENFLYPVDSKLYAEYYEAIEEPMDLSSVQEKFKGSKYPTLQALYDDLHLISSNCKAYNLEGSEIYEQAEQFQNFIDALFEEKFDHLLGAADSSAAVEPVKRKRESSDAAVNVDKLAENGVELPQQVMAQILQELKAHVCAKPFLGPVDEAEAPGYRNVVKYPMDLKTAGKLLKSGAFAQDKQDFVSTIRLIWNNCYLYNAPNSEIYKWAVTLEELFEKLIAEAVKVTPVAVTSKPEGKSAAVESEEDKPAKKKRKAESSKGFGATATALQAIVQELSKDPRALPFLKPVDPDEAPGYHDIIKEPMDVALVASRLKNYESNPSKFLADFNLMFDNCQKYNVESSEIYKTAEDLRVWVKAKYDKSLPTPTEESLSFGAVPWQDDYEEMPFLPPVVMEHVKAPPFDLAAPTQVVMEDMGIQYKKKHPSVNENLSSSLALTVTEADKLLDDLLLDESGSNQYVKMKAYHMAARNLSNTVVPYNDAKVTVESFGHIEEIGSKLSKNYLFNGNIVPNCYSTSCTVRLVEKKKSKRSKAADWYVDIELVSFVVYRSGNTPLFTVALKDDINIAHSKNPKDAWYQATREVVTQGIILHLGSKLRRCRSVLNKVCTSPLCMPFLEKVDPNLSWGADYYKEIKSPMWFFEIRQRLVEGYYESETEFYVDMQLVFTNALAYNAPNSDMHGTASKLRIEFELLYCQWVLNVEDRSPLDLAKGPWDHWTYLRYFDCPNNMANVCRATGAKGTEASMLFCVSCEDQYMPSALGVALTAQNKKSWHCPRCAFVNELDVSAPLCIKGYSAEEHGKPIFTRAPELGAGWLKATDRSNPSMNWCLSPMGDMVHNSFPAVDKQKKEEAPLIEKAKQARAVEFAKESKMGHRLDANSRRKLAGEVSAEARRGSLAFLDQVPASYEWSLITNIGQVEAIDIENLPSTGFFSLDLDPIKKLIEGVRNSTTIPGYTFCEATNIRNSFITELTRSRESRRAKKANEERANEYIAKERWYWETKDATASVSRKGGESVTDLSREIYENVGNLFPEEFTSEEGEMLLSIWDFFTSARPLVAENGVALYDLVRCMSPSANPMLPSVGQVVFDELCCSLTTLLLEDVKRRLVTVNAVHWQEILWSKPMNIVSWPAMATQALIFLSQSQYFQRENGVQFVDKDAVMQYIKKPFDGDNLVRMQLLSLAVSHPLFVVLVSIEQKCTHASFDPMVIQRKSVNATLEAGNGYNSVSEFIDDIERLYTNIYAEHEPASVESSIARVFEKWFVALLAKVGISHSLSPPPTLSPEFSHPSTWSDAARIKTSDVSLRSAGLVRSFDSFVSKGLGFGSFYGSGRIEKPFGQFEESGEDILSGSYNELTGHPACFGSLGVLIADSLLIASHLSKLEVALSVLSSSNPDVWTKSERLAVLSTLVNLTATSAAYKDHTQMTRPPTVQSVPRTAHQARAGIGAQQARSARALMKDVSDIPPQPRLLVEAFEDVPVSARSSDNMKCFFSGTEALHAKNDPWVYVPKYLLRTPSGGSVDVAGEERPIALKALALRVAAARELAEEEHSSEGERETQQLAYLTSNMPEVLCSFVRQVVVPVTAPLGFDRHGSEYWMLGAQHCELLLGVGRGGDALTDPTVLIRLRSGWWGRHTGNNLVGLINSLSSGIPCEMELRSKLIERLYEARKALNAGYFSMLRIHSEWFDNYAKVEECVARSEATILGGKNPIDEMKLVETMFARCIENRLSMLAGLVTRNECPDVLESPPITNTRPEKEAYRKKRLKDLQVEEFLELHHTKGWLRNDLFSEMKALHSSTVASRLLADPTTFNLFSLYMKKCVSRKSSEAIPTPSELPVDDAMESIEMEKETEVETEAVDEVIDDKAVAVEEEDLDDADPGNVLRKKYSNLAVQGAKTVEQIDPENDQVVHRYFSCRDAARQMQIIPAGISQCCSGQKYDYHNFKWRYYKGPPIYDFEEDNKEPGRKTIQELLHMRRSHNNPEADKVAFAKRAAFKVKPVEQLDLATGEVVRRYPSGTDAALLMKASQGGISQCCNGVKADVYNFRWRWYEGPPIDFEVDHLAPGRKSIEDLLQIRFGSSRSGARGGGRYSLDGTDLNNFSQKLSSQHTQYNQPRGLPQKHFAASVVRVDYRLLKLKTELINIVLLLPQHLVGFKAAANSIKSSIDSAMIDSDPYMQDRMAFLGKLMADFVSFEDSFIRLVQLADTPQELLDCVIFFEKSLHPSVLVGYSPEYLPTAASSASVVAVRLYSLDRAIRYEDIDCLNLACDGKYKPRVQFVPRCLVSSTCSKPSGHGGKCFNGFESTYSRFLEVTENNQELRSNLVAPTYAPPATLSYSTAAAAAAAQQSASNRPANPYQYKRPGDERTDDTKRRTLDYHYNYEEIEVENIIPYVPKAHELTKTMWV